MRTFIGNTITLAGMVAIAAMFWFAITNGVTP